MNHPFGHPILGSRFLAYAFGCISVPWQLRVKIYKGPKNPKLEQMLIWLASWEIHRHKNANPVDDFVEKDLGTQH